MAGIGLVGGTAEFLQCHNETSVCTAKVVIFQDSALDWRVRFHNVKFCGNTFERFWRKVVLVAFSMFGR